MPSPRKSFDNILEHAANKRSRPSLDIPSARPPNFSRPLFQQSSVSFPSGKQDSQRLQRLHSIDALSNFPGKHAAARYGNQHHVYETGSNINTLLDSFPAVPSAVPLPQYETFPSSRGRSVSLGASTLMGATTGANADHKKSLSDPTPTTRPKLSPKKSFKQSIRSIFHRESRKSNAGSPPDSLPSSASPMTPSDETVRMRTWTLSRSPGKQRLPHKQSFDVEPPSPTDSAALADHEHLAPITWGAGKTVNVSADGLARKASVLRLDADTLVLRLQPSPSRAHIRRQPTFQLIDGKPACRRCGELFYLERSPACGCGAESDEDCDYGEVIDKDGGDDFFANDERLPAYAH